MLQKYFIFWIASVSFFTTWGMPVDSNSALNQQHETKETVQLALVGGRLIDGFGGLPLENSVVLISGNTITSIGQVGQLEIPDSARVIDTNGMTVLPGLWESHGHLMHLAEGTPTDYPKRYKDRAIELMAIAAEINLRAGVTSFRDTGSGVIAEQLVLREEIRSGKKLGPRLFFAGPVIRQGNRGKPETPGDYKVSSPSEARSVTEEVIALGVDQIKVYGFWDLDILSEITSTAHAAGIGVDADVRHISAYRTAIRAGVDRLHHVFTADPLSDYSDEDFRLIVRGESPVGTGPSANILRGPYIIPTLEMRKAYARAFKFPEVIDHPRFREQFPPDIYEYLQEGWSNINAIPWGIGATERVEFAKRKLQRFIEAGGREQLVAGCDTGSPLNFHTPLTREIINLAEAGLTPMEAIQSATLRPAQMQGVSEQVGTVSVGKFADMIVVDGDPLTDLTLLRHRIRHVVKDGFLIE